MRLAGIDAGGTSFKLAIGRAPGDIVASHRVPTTTPEETLAAVRRWFLAEGRVDALGIAAFGPVGLERGTGDYGRITGTAKPGWHGADLLAPLRDVASGPVALALDVVGAAMAEHRWGAGHGMCGFGYVTVGTGIGMGLLMDGRPVHGMQYPEAGHIFPRRHASDLGFAGVCALHGDCLEGLASAPAIRARWGLAPEAMADDHPGWALLGDYLGQLAHQAVMIAGVDRIVLGGGVGTRPILAHHAAATLARLAGDYGQIIRSRGGAAQMVVPAALGDRSGVMGALLLAEQALLAERLARR